MGCRGIESAERTLGQTSTIWVIIRNMIFNLKRTAWAAIDQTDAFNFYLFID